MKFQLGDIVMEGNTTLENKTRKYLLPILKKYGEEFTVKFNSIFKVACGVGDIVVENSGLHYEKHLFVLININLAKKQFINFIEWIKLQDYYEDDYVYGNIQKSKLHMIVLKIPDKYCNSLNELKGGKYSKMYNKEDIDKLFNNYPDITKVLIKEANYKLNFIKKVNEMYQTRIEDFDIDDYELDFPFYIEEEKF